MLSVSRCNVGVRGHPPAVRSPRQRPCGPAQVRGPARAALSRLLGAEPAPGTGSVPGPIDAASEPFLVAAVPMAVKLADRYRGRFAFGLVHAAVLAAPDDLR